MSQPRALRASQGWTSERQTQTHVWTASMLGAPIPSTNRLRSMSQLHDVLNPFRISRLRFLSSPPACARIEFVKCDKNDAIELAQSHGLLYKDEWEERQALAPPTADATMR